MKPGSWRLLTGRVSRRIGAETRTGCPDPRGGPGVTGPGARRTGSRDAGRRRASGGRAGRPRRRRRRWRQPRAPAAEPRATRRVGRSAAPGQPSPSRTGVVGELIERVLLRVAGEPAEVGEPAGRDAWRTRARGSSAGSARCDMVLGPAPTPARPQLTVDAQADAEPVGRAATRARQAPDRTAGPAISSAPTSDAAPDRPRRPPSSPAVAPAPARASAASSSAPRSPFDGQTGSTGRRQGQAPGASRQRSDRPADTTRRPARRRGTSSARPGAPRRWSGPAGRSTSCRKVLRRSSGSTSRTVRSGTGQPGMPGSPAPQPTSSTHRSGTAGRAPPS